MRGALAYDVAGDGTIFYSTGRELMRLRAGKSERFAELEEIEQLCVLD